MGLGDDGGATEGGGPLARGGDGTPEAVAPGEQATTIRTTSTNPIHVLRVMSHMTRMGSQCVAGTSMLDARPEAVRAFVAATLRAMREIAADPDAGLDAAIAAVPDLASSRETQKAILAATIETWAPQGGGPDDYGAIDEAGWQASINYLTGLKLVPKPVTVDDLIREDFLPGSMPAPS